MSQTRAGLGLSVAGPACHCTGPSTATTVCHLANIARPATVTRESSDLTATIVSHDWWRRRGRVGTGSSDHLEIKTEERRARYPEHETR